MGKQPKGKKQSIKSNRQPPLTKYGFSIPGDGWLNPRYMYSQSYNPHDSTRRREVKDRITKDRNIFKSMLNMDSDSYNPTEIDIVNDDPTKIDNGVDDSTEIYNPGLPDTNIRMPNRSTNNGDKLWIDISIPDNQQKYKLPYFHINDDLFHSNEIDPLSVIYAYKVIKGDGYAMKKYTPGYGVWEEVKSELYHDDKDIKFYVEYLYNRTESNDEDVYNLNPVEESRVKNDILLLFRGEIDKSYPLTYKYDEEPTYLVDHCDRKYGDPKYGCPISTYIYKSKIPYPNAKAGGFKRKSKKVKKKSKKVKKNVSKRI